MFISLLWVEVCRYTLTFDITLTVTVGLLDSDRCCWRLVLVGGFWSCDVRACALASSPHSLSLSFLRLVGSRNQIPPISFTRITASFCLGCAKTNLRQCSHFLMNPVVDLRSNVWWRKHSLVVNKSEAVLGEKHGKSDGNKRESRVRKTTSGKELVPDR